MAYCDIPGNMDVSFMKFLKDNNACEEFLNNMDISIDCLKKNYTPKNWICGAFKWANTAEGKEYWEALNNKWLEYSKATYYNITFGDENIC